MVESVKLIKFNGDWLIAEVEEIPGVEFGDPDCVLKYAYQIEGECLGPWPAYTDEREMIIRSSEITVITEPKAFYLSSYITLVDEEKA
jgi:hypothetical protein